MTSDQRLTPDWRNLSKGRLQDVHDLIDMLLEYRFNYISNPDKYKPLIAEAEADLNRLLDHVPGLPESHINLHLLANSVQLEQLRRRCADATWELLIVEHDINLDTRPLDNDLAGV